MLFCVDFITRRKNVSVGRDKADRFFLPVSDPGNCLFVEVEFGVAGNVNNIRVCLVDSVTFRHDIHHVAVKARNIFKACIAFDKNFINGKLFSKIITGESNSPARMLFFAKSVEIR